MWSALKIARARGTDLELADLFLAHTKGTLDPLRLLDLSLNLSLPLLDLLPHPPLTLPLLLRHLSLTRLEGALDPLRLGHLPGDLGLLVVEGRPEPAKLLQRGRERGIERRFALGLGCLPFGR